MRISMSVNKIGTQVTLMSGQTGKIAGHAILDNHIVYLVELDSEFQSYLKDGPTMFISTVVVDISSLSLGRDII